MFTDVRSGIWKGEVQALAFLLLFFTAKEKISYGVLWRYLNIFL